MKSQEILQAAIELFSENGYYNTTTRMISQKANVAVGSLYTHFKNKEAILETLFNEAYEKRLLFINSIMDSEYSSLDILDKFIDFHFNELLKNKALSIVLIRESLNPELLHLEGIQNFLIQLPKIFKVILRKAQESGEIRNLNISLTSEIIFNTIRATVYSAASNQFKNLESLKEELKVFIRQALSNYKEATHENY